MISVSDIMNGLVASKVFNRITKAYATVGQFLDQINFTTWDTSNKVDALTKKVDELTALVEAALPKGP